MKKVYKGNRCTTKATKRIKISNKALDTLIKTPKAPKLRSKVKRIKVKDAIDLRGLNV